VKEDTMSVRQEIIAGIESILWASAWADHVEEHQCTNLSGMRIEDIMPSIPKEASRMAQDLARKYESMNGASLDTLYAIALKADGQTSYPGSGKSSPEAFGDDLAFMAMGAGVSWFDEHDKFPLKKPYIEEYELRFIADERCREEGNPACKECGVYNRRDKSKCENCGKKLS
jgi:hypothetical protein